MNIFGDSGKPLIILILKTELCTVVKMQAIHLILNKNWFLKMYISGGSKVCAITMS